MHTDAVGIAEFADKNSICTRTVYNEISAGRLIARKVGARTIITKEDGDAWRKSLPKMKPAAVAA